MPPRSRGLNANTVDTILSSFRPRTQLIPSSKCLQCRHTLSQQGLNPTKRQHAIVRAFSTSLHFQKKSSASSKSNRSSPDVTPPKNKSRSIPDNAATRERDQEIDPYDFTDLNAAISKALARLKDALTRTRDAGRITPEMLEQLPVEVNMKGHDAHGASAHKEKLKLGDMASVVPKGGRTVQVFCAEEAVCRSPACIISTLLWKTILTMTLSSSKLNPSYLR
jgi:hypothetical protein